MKTLKIISAILIISLAAFVCVGKDYISFSDHSLYVIENTPNDTKSDNSITHHNDLSEADVTLSKNSYFFDLKNLSSEQVIPSDFLFPQNTYFCIWQPPKIS